MPDLSIPESVIDEANSLRESWRDAEADQLIARWAREAALDEAEQAIDRVYDDENDVYVAPRLALRALRSQEAKR